MSIKVNILSYFLKGNTRSKLAKKNIAYSIFLKGLSVVTTFLLVPITINYISATQYGIWLTLSSIVSWMSFFDVGLGNGLKNKLAQNNALDQNSNSKVFVSTTYVLLLIISIGLFSIFFTANTFIDWNKILNVKNSTEKFSTIALTVFGLFCVQFVVQLLNTVLTACHAVAKVSLLLLISQVITLLCVFLLTKYTHSSLLLLVSINGGIPVIVHIIASIWYYKNELKKFAPSFKFVDFKYAPLLLGSGGIFFIIQIGALILFQTDNIVIVQIFGPASVTEFNIAYKLFSVFIIGFNIIVTPLWSAFTDAYVVKDFGWIESIMTKMKYVWLFISISSVLLLFVAPYIYKIWIKNTIEIPISLSLSMSFYIIAYTWQTLHVYFLNGINKIRLQLYLVIISSIINIPIAIFLAKRIGLAGITISNAVLFTFMGLIFSYQTKKILRNEAKGILNA
ncbi:MAG: lipopolysaccharide biosynthesis protein [Janthinobacterium lividum]